MDLVALLPLSQGWGSSMSFKQVFRNTPCAIGYELAELQASISEQKIPLSKRLTEPSELVSKDLKLTKRSERQIIHRRDLDR